MINTTDIRERIESDFGEKAGEAFKTIHEALTKTDYLNHDRIIRCIVFLTEKDIDKLKDCIETAAADPRDVMFWAEYTNLARGQKPRRIRDFNRAFDQCEIDVKE